MSAISAVFIFIFFATLITSYIIIRRGLMKFSTAGWIATVINVVVLTGFGITREDVELWLALIGGAVVGIAITGTMLSMAAFFKSNQPQNLAAYDAMKQEKE
jgi:hypothetical protein